jgi:hypothetical protein
MLKKTLIATAAISATLLAAATMLPALAQSRSAASASATSASTAAPSAQAPVDAASQVKLSAANDTGTRKAEGSGHDARHGDEGHGGSGGMDKEKHTSRD